MRPIGTDGVAWTSVCVSVCWSRSTEPIEMPLGGLTQVGPRNHGHGGRGRTNPFATARGDKTEVGPFFKIP